MSIEARMALNVNFLQEFIESYRKHPALWMVGSKAYVDKHLKKVGYNELISKCWDFNIKADKEFVVRKINSLRGAFRKEHNKVLAAAERGLTYVPTLWYYKLLLFTSDKDPPTSLWKSEHLELSFDELSGEAGEELFTENSQGACNGIESTTSDESRDRKPIVNGADQENDEVLDDGLPEDHLQIRLDYPKDRLMRNPRSCHRTSPYPNFRKYYDSDKEIDEFSAIGINVAAKLKRMDETQRFYAEILLTKILGLGLLGKLNEDSTILVQEKTSNCQNRTFAEESV